MKHWHKSISYIIVLIGVFSIFVLPQYPIHAQGIDLRANEAEQGQDMTQNAEETASGTDKSIEQNIKEIPKIRKVTIRSKNSFLVTIKKIKGVSGYYIFDIQNDGNLKKLKTISGNNQDQVIINGLKYKKTYHLTVQAYKKDKKTGKIDKSDYDKTGIKKELKVKSKYKKGLKYYYDMEGNLIKDVESFLPKNSKYRILVNTKACVMTIYAKDGRKGYTIPVKSFLCSPGAGTQSGTFKLGEKYRYRTLFYSSYSQWTAVIHGNILFHTTPYKSYGNNDTLDVGEYNKLGTAASHGCVRLQCVAVKWIYDHCSNGTTVKIYKSSNPGPFGKPKLEKLPKWHKWDPTDPTAVNRCKKHGCKHKLY